MRLLPVSRRAAARVGLAGVLAVSVAGCGGDQGAADQAVVHTEPGVPIPAVPGPDSPKTVEPAPSAGDSSAAPKH